MRRFLLFLLFVITMLLLPSFAKYLTDGFRIAKMKVNFPSHPEWDVALDPILDSVFKQRFTYLGKGSQCYVFQSKDQNYVIKFFRFSDPSEETKIKDLFEATHLAYTHLKNETGLIYIHLNPTEKLLPTIYAKDAVGRPYKFELDKCRFAVQKKAIPFKIAFNEALKNPELIQKRIDQFATLLATRSNLGISNADPSLSRNFGFLESQAVEIDFGNFRHGMPHSKEAEIERYAKKLRSWLKQKNPECADYLDRKIHEKKSIY